ncbi:MAG: hypothetical protein EOP62_01335 [Sphingomonadales bacterium]|nr:MAG: hypothetical protein EOP62_01335 [Sphingomonadales bacterium]
MNPTYTVSIDRFRKLLRVSLGGFFSVSDVVSLERDKRAALADLNCGRNQHYTLVDVSACKLQPQDVVAAFQVAIADQRFMARKIAFVTESSLARMQVRRIVQRPDADIFTTLAQAEAWLFEPIRLRAVG